MITCDYNGMKKLPAESCQSPYKFNVKVNDRVVGYVIADGVSDAMDKARTVFGRNATI